MTEAVTEKNKQQDGEEMMRGGKKQTKKVFAPQSPINNVYY